MTLSAPIQALKALPRFRYLSDREAEEVVRVVLEAAAEPLIERLRAVEEAFGPAANFEQLAGRIRLAADNHLHGVKVG